MYLISLDVLVFFIPVIIILTNHPCLSTLIVSFTKELLCGLISCHLICLMINIKKRGHCGYDRMVVGFTTTYAINAY